LFKSVSITIVICIAFILRLHGSCFGFSKFGATPFKQVEEADRIVLFYGFFVMFLDALFPLEPDGF
jgi:hypothetical protein